jgi:hypothetical protein
MDTSKIVRFSEDKHAVRVLQRELLRVRLSLHEQRLMHESNLRRWVSLTLVLGGVLGFIAYWMFAL